MANIYSATYSGVEVYELLDPTGSIMKRKADNWVNATHILKAAKFAKAQRTRILEREVQTGTHEKIQGGFGKYQGTWVPVERATEIATQYGVLDVLAPLFNYRTEPGAMSPPPAPKHHHKASHAASMAAKQKSTDTAAVARRTTSMPAKVGEPKKRGRPAKSSLPKLPELVPRRTQSEIQEIHPVLPQGEVLDDYKQIKNEDGCSSDVEETVVTSNLVVGPSPQSSPILMHEERKSNNPTEEYIDMLKTYFTSHHAYSERDVARIAVPPRGVDVDTPIDIEGHSAFSWACALGDRVMAQNLMENGANIRSCNVYGESPLIRASIFANGYEKRIYPYIFMMLKDTLFQVDNSGMSVLHRIMKLKKPKLAQYYLGVVLSKLREIMSADQIISFLHLQDKQGDTALHLAARNQDNEAFTAICNAGADVSVRNHSGATAVDILSQQHRSAAREGHHLLGNFDSSSATATMACLPLITQNMKNLMCVFEDQIKLRQLDIQRSKESLQSINSTLESTNHKISQFLDRQVSSEDVKELIFQHNRTRNGLEAHLKQKVRQLRYKIEVSQRHKLQEGSGMASAIETNDRAALQSQLTGLQIKRKQLVEKIIQTYMASDGKIQKYRKVIASGTNMEYDIIDKNLDEILLSLELQ